MYIYGKGVILISIVDNIEAKRNISLHELQLLLNGQEAEYLRERAAATAQKFYGKDIYVRGLIEFTNYCKNDCFYCGIRRSNREADRYRLGIDEILTCCYIGYDLGYRTFVLQGGEDMFFTDDVMCHIVSGMKKRFSDCAVTLSLGERSRESYERLFAAGADRYLLRHETAKEEHYRLLHPAEMFLENRMKCLRDLKEIGFQVGAGFMVGSPYQTVENIFADLQFLRDFQPHMVGIGPFIPQHSTPFANEAAGTCDLTLKLLSIVRLLLPNVLLPATTALGTVDPAGREKGIMAGANVVMPNLSPKDVREKYMLYDNKLCTGKEAAEYIGALKHSISNIGYQIVCDRGDFKVG